MLRLALFDDVAGVSAGKRLPLQAIAIPFHYFTSLHKDSFSYDRVLLLLFIISHRRQLLL